MKLPKFLTRANKSVVVTEDKLATDKKPKTSEKGRVATPENSLKYLYQRFWVDPDLRAAVLDIRAMDKADPRVKKIHRRMARDVTKGGVLLRWNGQEDERVSRLFAAFRKRLKLDKREKLKSDTRGAVMEGNVVLQWVINEQRQVASCIRMPAETIVPQVDVAGRFKNSADAYHQVDALNGKTLAKFAEWQLTIGRLDPDNYDDYGAMGRPYLDANRAIWRKLNMTEEDLVIRRRHRAPQKLGHFLDGATDTELQAYEAKVRASQGQIETDYFSNKKGSIQNITGDANLEQIADVSYLLDTFFAGSPAPKGLFGYVDGLARDVLDDLKRDYFEEIDGLQDVLADCYAYGFELELLLNGLLPEQFNYEICFAERRTETPNQRADRALKYQALNVPIEECWREAGLDPIRLKAKWEEQKKGHNPYPDDDLDDDEVDNKSTKVSITPNNAAKGESATSINN